MAFAVKFVQEGNSIDYTPGSAVSAGDVIVQEDLVGVAVKDIAANALGALAVAGVFEFPKAAGSSTAIAAGAKVYWDAGDEVATTTSGGNKLIGKAVAAATDGAETVNVRLSQ